MAGEAPKLEPVTSSNILAMAHDPATDHAYVQFRTGGTWRYGGVTKPIYDEWRAQESLGGHFHRFIKGNHPGEKMP